MTSPNKRIRLNSMQENEIRANFARNVKELRMSKKLNQIQLGEKLSYSSKAVSKWENGDVMPDIITLKMIADFFSITVDELISDNNVVVHSHRKRNRALISVSSHLLPYLVAAIVYLILALCGLPWAWKSFIVAIPASAIVLVVFAAMWYKRVHLILSIIYLVLGIALMSLVITNFILWWGILIVAFILIVLAIIFFMIVFKKEK